MDHRQTLTKYHVLLVKKTPVDDILDDLVQHNVIIDKDYNEFIIYQQNVKDGPVSY